MKPLHRMYKLAAAALSLTAIFSAVAIAGSRDQDLLEEYLKKFPYQETYNYIQAYSGGDPSVFNTWAANNAALVKAGEDVIVRSNNDTFYKLAFVNLKNGPVILRAASHEEGRFSSFQLMDDRNINYRNVIAPTGTYALYHGKKPDEIAGELIKSPSEIGVVVVRIEVKNAKDPVDVANATSVFDGITIDGPDISQMPALNLLDKFDSKTVEAAEELMDQTANTTPFRFMVAGEGQVPDQVSYLQLATGAKIGWGGPVAKHSTYEAFFRGSEGEVLQGRNGTYAVTTEAPPVNAFWSVTVYDTSRGGFFHPNKDDRYHINDTMAVPNKDGTYTFRFKTSCSSGDINCLEVPEGPFDIATRYYLPKKEIISGKWGFPTPSLVNTRFNYDRNALTGAKPWTFEDFEKNRDEFSFAVIGDRTGGADPRSIFERAMAQLNLLRPEFVINVGDMIEGYSDNPQEIEAEWSEFDGMLNKLKMPFFRVAGNHDLSNEIMKEMYRDRYGAEYYHFVYNDVLFIVLNTEDFPRIVPEGIKEDLDRLKKAQLEDPAKARALLEEFLSSDTVIAALGVPAKFSDRQIAYVKDALDRNPNVRWTFLFMHEPAWKNPSKSFLEIEQLLQDRDYTFLAGHLHYYDLDERHGREYITMGPAGASWHKDGDGNVDHILWITVTGDSPEIAKITLKGIFDREGRRLQLKELYER